MTFLHYTHSDATLDEVALTVFNYSLQLFRKTRVIQSRKKAAKAVIIKNALSTRTAKDSFNEPRLQRVV